MFRRRSSSRHQPLNPIPSASAQSAASRAFLAHQASSQSLSSAAAATALRTHTPTPTAVENVQTKRMLQRQSSTASRASTNVSRGGRPLHRSNSSGSMTTRTFRDQSPGRPKSSSGETSAPSPPPIPPIPEGLPRRTGHERRSFSVQPATRPISPPIQRPHGRGASLDRVPSVSTGHPSQRGSSPGTGNLAEQDRPSSRTSINFSYPLNARPTSPRQSPVSPVQTELSHNQRKEPRSTSPLSTDEVSDIQYSVSNVANQKVKTKPKTFAPGSSEGSHLASGTTGAGPPTGTALETDLRIDSSVGEETSVAPESHIHVDQKEEPAIDEGQDVGLNRLGIEGASAGYADDVVTLPSTVRPRPKKRPSTVMEDHEGEERAEAAHNTVDDPSRGFTDRIVPTATASESEERRSGHRLQPAPVIQKRSVSPVRRSPSSSAPPSPSADKLSAERQGRQSSTSPNRSTRFSTTLSVSGPGAPLHEPPPRSMSPAKPALKNPSQPTASPDRRASTALRKAPSEISDGTSVASDDGSRSGSRKKTAKVSFDDEAEIVGVAASPPTSPDSVAPPSPREKSKMRTHWFGFGKKTGPRELSSDDEFDSIYKPRPALPSFGSVRGNRDVGEEEQVVSDNESTVSSLDNLDSVGIPLSSDHAIGGILTNAISELPMHLHDKSNEPLPPEVTSVEGTGQVSDSEESGSVTNEVSTQPLPTVQEEKEVISTTGTILTPSHAPDAAPESTKEPGTVPESIPVIEIQPATPALDESRASLEIQRMPGGFPSNGWDRAGNRSATNGTEVVQTSTGGFAPVSSDDSESDDDNSVYSDAAEDPADLDGDGFGSINAIVDSPLPVANLLPVEAPDSPTRKIPGFAATEPKVPSERLPAANKVPADSNTAVKEPAPQPVLTEQRPKESATQQPPTTDPAWPLKTPLSSSIIADTKLKKDAKYTSTSQNEGSHLRRALAGSEDQTPKATNRHSMAAPRVSSAPQSHKRTMSAGLPQNKNQTGTAPGQQVATKTRAQLTALSSTLGRTKSNDSDSSSSFKRPRRPSPSDSPIIMKRTLRGTGTRSLSAVAGPVERPTSSRGSMMRTTLRGPASSGRTSIIAGPKNKTSRSRVKSLSAAPLSFRSRFVDSDEEADAGRPRRFHSRFADSSDEDEPLSSKLRPVRGIPRRRDERDGDSTDLEDSSDEEAQRPGPRSGDRTEASRPQLTREEVEQILSQPKKRGFLARLTTTKKSRSKDGKVRKSELESAARRDTPLERSRLELEQMKGDQYLLNGYGAHTVTTVTAQSRSISPKLQKTHNEASWPLPVAGPSDVGATGPTTSPDVVPDRPQTSDGIVNGSHAGPAGGAGGWSARFPKLRNRQDSSSSIASVTASDVVIGSTGRKKRFPLLRKAFGLRD